MAKLYNLARMTTATVGTGTLTLGSAVSGFLTFALAGVANGNDVAYAIRDGANSEHGHGTYTSAGTTLTRNVTKSTNSNSAISLSGNAEVLISPRAEDLPVLDQVNTFTASQILNGGATMTPGAGVIGLNATLNGAQGLYLTGTPDSAQGFVHIRPNSGSKGYISFTEDSVADRWAIGCENGSGDLNFRTGSVTGTLEMSLSSGGLLTLTGGQIKFPPVQNASADANTLDDYEEGTWTPAVSFVTAGNLSVTYSTQSAKYVKIGRQVLYTGLLVTSAFTHTTASGAFKLTGYPFAAASKAVGGGSIVMTGYTKAGFTSLVLETSVSATAMFVLAGGSGQTATELTTADVPTGGSLLLMFNGHYDA